MFFCTCSSVSVGRSQGLLWSRRGKYCSAQTNESQCLSALFRVAELHDDGRNNGEKSSKHDKIVNQMSFLEKERGEKGKKHGNNECRWQVLKWMCEREEEEEAKGRNKTCL